MRFSLENDLLRFELGPNIETALSLDEFISIHQFFVQKYNEDMVFAERS